MSARTDHPHDPISFTALKVLQQRARFSSIEGCRDMARAAGIRWHTPWYRAVLRRIAGGKTASADYLQLRHDALSAALLDYPGCAVLEFAAGFGTRGVSEHARREAYVETDLAAIQRHKVAAVTRLLGTPLPARLQFRAVNVTQAGDMAAIGDFVTTLPLTRPLVLVHEGLLMYLDAGEQALVRDQMAALLARLPAGSAWLTSDFSERNTDQTLVQRLLSRRLGGRIGRGMTYFRDNRQVDDFLAVAGLQAEWLANPVAATEPGRHALAEGFRVHRITQRAPPAAAAT